MFVEKLDLYKTLLEKGKSPIYAKQYVLHFLDDYGLEYCDLYASKYEECINIGRDEDKAKLIATKYEDLYDQYWPEDDNILGIEGYKAYMEGFEYAIDNGIDSPEKFAEEYEKEALGRLFPEVKDPPYRIKGKYEDIISKLLNGKG